MGQIASFCTMLDADKSGAVSIPELVSFIGADSGVSQRTGKSMHGSMLDPLDMPTNSGGKQNTQESWRTKPARPYRPPLDPDVIVKIREKMKCAAYTGHLGRELDVLFGRFDKDHSGQLEDEEVRLALRRSLRIRPLEVSDAQIWSLCSLLDSDNSGSVSIRELVDFIGPDTQVSRRTGRRFWDVDANEASGGPTPAQQAHGRTPRGVRLDPIAAA